MSSKSLQSKSTFSRKTLSVNFTSAVDKKKVPTFAYQATLPKLPVAPLVPAFEKYLKSVQPFQTPQEHENTKKLVADFVKPGGQGEQLRQLLVERANKSKTHWLQEWWDSWGYFEPRYPIIINVNYYFHYDIYKPENGTQAKRAAHLVSGALEFRRLLDTQELEPEMLKDTPLDMDAYNWMFNTTRIPHPKEDFLQKYDSKTSKHILVSRRNKFYYVEVVHEDGTAYSTSDIQKQLEKVISIADQDKTVEVPIGVLTADDRSYWATAREKIIAASPSNKESLEKIQSSIFMVCLDNASPTTSEDIGRRLWHGDGRSRWFDKSFQLIVFENGTCGLNGEHSKLDGMPVKRLSDFIMFSYKEPQNARNATNLPTPKKIEFTVNKEINDLVKKSEKNFDQFVHGYGHRILNWNNYGSGFIKSVKISPDAYIQMAIQWTYYKMYGKFVATYESAQTKKYAFGRTEVGRTVTNESVAWLQAMSNKSSSPKERYDLLQKAAKAHGQYMKEAGDGFGCDRVMLGMKMIANEKGIAIPEVFKDPVHAKSSHWTISTSQLSSDGFYVGFGPVVEDGFGVCYSIRDKSITMTMSSHAKPETNIDQFYQHLNNSLGELKSMCEAGAATSAKL